MNATPGPITTDLGPIPLHVRLDVARNLRAQSLEALQAAIADWWASAGDGEYHAVCRRFVRRCLSEFRWDDAFAYQVYRETIGNRRTA